MKITIAELKQKQALLSKVDLSVNDKLTYAVKKTLKRIDHTVKPIMDDLQEKITDFTIEKASVDEKGNLIVKDEKHSFTPLARKELVKFLADQNRKFDAVEVKIEPFVFSRLLPGFERASIIFDDYDVEELTGLLFN